MTNYIRKIAIAALGLMTYGNAAGQISHFDMELTGNKIKDLITQEQYEVTGKFAPENVPGVNGNALRFDGYTSYIDAEINTNALNGQALTVSLWCAAQTYPMVVADIADNKYTYIAGNLDDGARSGFAFVLSSQGNYGFDIYLTQGMQSTYVGFTEATTYEIDTLQYAGAFDGIIIKSTYSKYKTNASDGAKIVFNETPPSNENNDSNISGGNNNENNTNDDVTINPNSISIKMSGLTLSLKINATFTELGTYAIDDILYNNTSIKNEVDNLSVITNSITKEGSTALLTPNDITSSTGKYNVVYSVTFTYKNTLISKNFTQVVVVKNINRR